MAELLELPERNSASAMSARRHPAPADLSNDHGLSEEFRQAFERLDAYLKRCGYMGHEFDDMLSSPLMNFLTFGNLYLKRCVVQVGKLLPINIRPLVGVPKRESTKARGFFAKGYLAMHQATGDDRFLHAAQEQLDWLLQHRITNYPGYSWGNQFNFASRGGYFPEGLPTVVWTALITESFETAYKLTGDTRYLDVIKGACQFVVEALARMRTDAPGFCIAYAPGLTGLIHNANLFGASLLMRGYRQFADKDYLDIAEQAYTWTLAGMNSDHSWYYGAESKHRWIDNFHTAYILDALLLARQVTGDAIVSSDLLAKAYRYWVDTFFLDDGTPRYYDDRTYPLDIQCATQAVETFTKFSDIEDDALAMAEKVCAWTVRHMQKPNGAFRYRIGRVHRNELENIHWGQSTMHAALGLILCAQAQMRS